MQTFAIIYSQGDAWLPNTPMREQPLRPHGMYMKQLYDAGTLLHGGPFTDDAGGMSIIRVEDEAEAQRIIAADPAVQTRLMVATLHPWYMVDWATFGQA